MLPDRPVVAAVHGPRRGRSVLAVRATLGLLVLPALLALLGAALGGRAWAEPPASPAPAPLTALEAGELGRATDVLLGTLLEQRDLRGPALARFAVVRWLKGGPALGEAGRGADVPGLPAVPARPAEVLVLVGGPRNTADKQRPSAAYLDRRPGTTYVLFLVAASGDATYRLENRIEIRGLEGQEKVRAIEAQVALSACPDPELRARRTRDHLLGALQANGAWTRANAARELSYLSGVRPDLFPREVRTAIEEARDATSAPAVRRWLDALLARLPPLDSRAPRERVPVPAPAAEAGGAAGSAPAAAAPTVPAPGGAARIDLLDAALRSAGPRAATRALVLFREEQEPEVQAWLVDWLADSGHAEALPALRAAYATADAPVVREALVRATGLLGGEADVAWLKERLLSPHLRDAAVLALARLRTPTARAALEQLAAASAAGSEEQRDLARRIEVLLSSAFEDADRLERGR